MKRDEITIMWSSNEEERETLRVEVENFDHDEIETRGIEGTPDLIIWAVTLVSGSPLLIKLIDFIDQRLRERHNRKTVHGLKLERNGAVEIEEATPDQVIDLLREIRKGRISDRK